MKMFFKIIKYRFIVSIKHPVVLVCLTAALFAAAFAGIYADKTQKNTALYPIAIVDEDGGDFVQIFIDEISKNEQVEINILSKDKALRQVSVGKLDGAFLLVDGFSEKIKNNDFSEIVEFISPSVTTSAYPVSEIVSSEIVDLWLMQLVENTLRELHAELGENAEISYEQVMTKIDADYITDDIISIDYIGDGDIIESKNTAPIDKAIGIYAAFVIFAIMLSSEWIFNIKKKGLQNRFISNNTDIAYVCLGSQAASALVSILFFIPLIIFLSIYLQLSFWVAIYSATGMLLFSLCICIIAFIISTFTENLTQLVVVGTSVSIINIVVSSLAMPLPDWANAANAVGKIFPGTYLSGCYDNRVQLLVLFLVTLIWASVGYLSVMRIRKIARK